MANSPDSEGRLTVEEWEWVSRALSFSFPDPPPDVFEGSIRARVIAREDWRRRVDNARRSHQRIMLRLEAVLAASDAAEERRHFNRLRRVISGGGDI